MQNSEGDAAIMTLALELLRDIPLKGSKSISSGRLAPGIRLVAAQANWDVPVEMTPEAEKAFHACWQGSQMLYESVKIP